MVTLGEEIGRDPRWDVFTELTDDLRDAGGSYPEHPLMGPARTDNWGY